MKKLFLFWVLALLSVQVPFVFSLNCDAVSSQNKDVCNEIIQMNLTDEEKLLLISNLDYTDNLQPNHFMVSSHNKGLTISSVPQGVQATSKTYIKNAWATIFSFSPSVYYNNSLFVPQESEVLTGFNYTLSLPGDYSSSGYPNTDGGDCKRVYAILQNTAKNNIFVNNLFSGEGKIVRIGIQNDSKITSNYSINFKLKTDHYKWNSYCCKKRYGICRKYCYSCDHRNAETIEESVSILTEKLVKYYPSDLFADISDLKVNPNSNEFKLNYSDSVSLQLKSSSFVFYKYAYSISSSFYPYNIYTIVANDLKQTSINNLYYTNNYIIVKDLSECYLIGYDFFNKVEKNCGLVNSKINLSINTDKTYYKLGDKVNVSIYPKNIYVNLGYANKSYYVKDGIILNSEKEYNKIYAEYNGEYSQKIIFIHDDSRLILAWKLFVVCIILILIYKIIKKHWRFT